MLKIIKDFLTKVYEYFGTRNLYLIESAREIRALLAELPPERLEQFGFKVYSQNDEDGIIAEIFNRIGKTNKVFVEFGVGDGTENNTAYLLRQDWSGLWIDGSEKQCAVIRGYYSQSIAAGKLTITNAMINRDNINGLISQCCNGEIDLLSVDIDGNDYHVLKAIHAVKPRVIVLEYNAKFPPPARWCLPYNPNYVWDGSDNMGLSLQTAVDLTGQMGYSLVATNLTGSNAFFVRNDLIGKGLFYCCGDVTKLYNPARYYLGFYSGHRAGKFLPSTN